MSDAAYVEADEPAPETDEPEVEAAEDQDPAGGEADGEDDEGEAKPKGPDWEKQAHNLKGAAARERSRRRAAEQQIRDLREQVEQLATSRKGNQPDEDELLAIIAELGDDDEDPVGDIAKVKKALKAYRARELQGSEIEQRRSALTRQFDKLRSSMSESEADFVQDFPDYHDAAAHYRKARVDELEDAGYAGQALQRKLADDLFGIVRMALEAGQDPAERVYALAKRRGFKAGTTTTDKKIDVLKRASEGARRPAGGGAPGGGSVLSWDDVAKLDGAAREKAWAKLRSRERGRA